MQLAPELEDQRVDLHRDHPLGPVAQGGRHVVAHAGRRAPPAAAEIERLTRSPEADPDALRAQTATPLSRSLPSTTHQVKPAW